MAKKTIHIFLGSSIVEFKTERLELTEFIRDLSDKFEDKFDIKIKPVICENVDTNVPRSGGKQDEYNELIKNSEMCFFIFFTRAGEFTCEEFEVAYKALQENGKPKVYVYFKNIPEGQSVDPSLGKFMSRIDNEIKHYHGTFDDIDTIKLRMLLNLKLQEMNMLEVRYKDGKCYADGSEVKNLDISKVSEFKNNSGLKELRAEFERVQQKYLEMRPLYDEKKNDENFYKEYADVASKRQILLDKIEETEREIFAFSLGMSDGINKGELIPRQQRAYRYFEQGELERANAELDGEVLDREFDNLLLMGEMVSKKVAVSIREYRTKIYILSAMTKYEGRFDEIEKIYEKIVPAAFQYAVETDVIYDYANYLNKQNKLNKAIEIYTELEAFYMLHSNMATDGNLARLYNDFGDLYDKLRNYKKAEEYLLKAIAIRSEIAKKETFVYNTDAYNIDLIESYLNEGVACWYLHHYKKAEEYILNAMKISEQFTNKNSSKQRFYFATIYNRIGIVCFDLREPKKAKYYYLKAIEIQEELAKEKPSEYNPDLAFSYVNMGLLYSDLSEDEKAERYYLNGITLYENIVKENPSAYNPDLAWSYGRAGYFYAKLNKFKRAEEFYLKAIEIYEKLAKENPLAYNHYLANNYKNIGNLYDDYYIVNKIKAKEYYLKAINIYELLYLQDSKTYIEKMKNLYRRIAKFYKREGDKDKAKEYRRKAKELNK